MGVPSRCQWMSRTVDGAGGALLATPGRPGRMRRTARPGRVHLPYRQVPTNTQMSIRHWFRNRAHGDDTEGGDLPPRGSREPERIRALGEYDSNSYPQELVDLLHRREEVAGELLRLNLIERKGRIAAIPKLQELLRRYPHPLAYEALIHAYLDAERYDEARGVAFAARARRDECRRSPHPEVRAEVDHLKEWIPEDIDQLREERQGKKN